MDGPAVPDRGEKAKIPCSCGSAVPLRARISESSVRVTGYGDDGADAGDGTSDVSAIGGWRRII